MAEVKIPFKAMFRERILDGRKTATTRMRRYGNPGDTFTAFGGQFEILAVSRTSLYEVGEIKYRVEGFASPQDFYHTWRQIHPGSHDWNQMVWFHVFSKREG